MLLRTEFISGGNPAKTGAFRCSTPGVRAVFAANRRDRRRIGVEATIAGGAPIVGRRNMAKVHFPDPERLAAKGLEAFGHVPVLYGSDGRYLREHTPQSETFAVIHAWKKRSSRHQFAISMTRPEWHPYRVLAYIIERTAPLRRDVLALLEQTRRCADENPELDLQREIEDLEKLSRTPWLYASMGKVGTVSGFVGNNDNGLVTLVRAVIEDAGLGDDPGLAALTTKDARLAWIGRVYVHSGYHQLLTRLAGNHGSMRTTRHYIRSMRYRVYSENEVRKVQDAVFSEIGCGRVVDPTRLRLLVNNGSITPEQERRLADYRQRTSLGMGCLNPYDPPKQVDPDHPDGELCRVQRCTGCPHGVVFPDSMPPLARRLAELMHLRRTMPMAAWDGSSFADEQESIAQTLTHFTKCDVETEIETWTEKLTSGEIAGHGTYPSY